MGTLTRACGVCRFAAGYGQMASVRWLVTRGADVNAALSRDGSALVRASRFGHGGWSVGNAPMWLHTAPCLFLIISFIEYVMMTKE